MRTLERRQTVGLGIAIAVIAVVGSLVATLGVVPFPDTPTVADEPDPAPPGRLAYTRWDRSEACLHIVDGSGDDREIACGESVAGETLVWTDDGYVAVTRWGLDGRELQVIDPATGAVVEVRQVDDGDPVKEFEEPSGGTFATSDDGTDARVRSSGGEVSVAVGTDGEMDVIWRATAPETYRLEEIRWSPDGAWLLIRDSRGSLLVMPADGSVGPRLWVEDAGWTYAWYIRDR